MVDVFLCKNLHEPRLCLIMFPIHRDQRSDGPRKFKTGISKGSSAQPSILRELDSDGEFAIRNRNFRDGNAGNEDGNAAFDNTKTPEERQRRGRSIEISSVKSGSDMALALFSAEER